MEIFVYIEIKNGKVLSGSLEMLTPALQLGRTTAVLVGSAQRTIANQIAMYGVPIILLDTQVNCQDEVLAALEQLFAEKMPDAVLFANTQDGKDLAPRLAARMNTGCVTDAIEIEIQDGKLVFTRPAFGGTVLEKLVVDGAKTQIATLRAGSYSKPTQNAVPAEVTVKPVMLDDTQVRARLVKTVQELTETINLESADVIVTGGRGMGAAEDFKLVEQLAELLGGVVGASRPAIEAGWISRVHQVGQSGKIVAPKLYIACGVSGAMQHISGVMGSKYIVAINKDESAPIFDIADIGIVGDVKEILPLMIDEIRRQKEA
ncbi:MAG: electron transfer flavoprotein subunit alpha/FixB family protein [Ruthenibacterium sp.]